MTLALVHTSPFTIPTTTWIGNVHACFDWPMSILPNVPKLSMPRSGMPDQHTGGVRPLHRIAKSALPNRRSDSR